VDTGVKKHLPYDDMVRIIAPYEKRTIGKTAIFSKLSLESDGRNGKKAAGRRSLPPRQTAFQPMAFGWNLEFLKNKKGLRINSESLI
jgi:hypothetical protein